MYQQVAPVVTKFLDLKSLDAFETASSLASVASAKVVGCCLTKVSQQMRSVEGKTLTEKKEKIAKGLDVLLKMFAASSREKLQEYVPSKECKDLFDALK